MNKPSTWKWLRNTQKTVMLAKLALLRKMCTKKLSVGSCAVHGISEVKLKNVLSFGQHSDKRTQSRCFQFTKQSEQLYPLDVRSDKISWGIVSQTDKTAGDFVTRPAATQAISKAKKKITFSWTGCCCRSEWAWSERARQLSNLQKITL